MKAVDYEWDAEEVTECGEVFDHFHAARLADVIEYVRQVPPNEGNHYRIVLVRDVIDDALGVVDRQWAYVAADGKLPARFDDGFVELSKVPKRFVAELERDFDNVFAG